MLPGQTIQSKDSEEHQEDRKPAQKLSREEWVMSRLDAGKTVYLGNGVAFANVGIRGTDGSYLVVKNQSGEVNSFRVSHYGDRRDSARLSKKFTVILRMALFPVAL